VGGDIEYRLNRWFGVDAALAYAKRDVELYLDFRFEIHSEFRYGTLMLTLDMHVISTRRLDSWLGPQIGYVSSPTT
jgi:hypothetical protein